MKHIYDPVADQFQAVNQLIIDQLYSKVPLVENIGHYLIEAGGKRLRPLLVLLSANACTSDKTLENQHIKLAAVIEFLHTATLLHDDVVDETTVRRGNETVNSKWGSDARILVGDFIYSRAFQIMVDMGDMRIMELLSATSNIIAEGEVFQLTKAGDSSATEQEYMEIIQHKTAELFAAATEGGAILAKVGTEKEQALRDFGLHLGIAFQLIDDILDYSGDPAEMGKNIGDDLAEGKPTLPLIYTMANGTAEQKQLVKEAIEAKSAEQIDEVIEAVQSCGALAYTRQKADEHKTFAAEALQTLPSSVFKEKMLDLAEFSVSRAA